MCSDEIDKKRWVEDYIKPAILKKSVDDYSDKIEKTLGSKGTKKKKVGQKRKNNVSRRKDNDDEDDEDDDDDVIAVEVLVDDDNTETEDDSEISNDEKKASSSSSSKQKKKKTKQVQDDGAPSNDLIAAIRGNAMTQQKGEAAFGSFMDSLEERYTSKKSKGTKKNWKNVEPDISDDEFAKIQARLLKKKK